MADEPIFDSNGSGSSFDTESRSGFVSTAIIDGRIPFCVDTLLLESAAVDTNLWKFKDPNGAAIFISDQIIPAKVSDWAVRFDSSNGKGNALLSTIFILGNFDVSIQFKYISGDTTKGIFRAVLGYNLFTIEGAYKNNSDISVEYGMENIEDWEEQLYITYSTIKGDCSSSYIEFPADTWTAGSLRIIRDGNKIQHLYYDSENDLWIPCTDLIADPDSDHPIAAIYVGLTIAKGEPSVAYDFFNCIVNPGVLTSKYRKSITSLNTFQNGAVPFGKYFLNSQLWYPRKTEWAGVLIAREKARFDSSNSKGNLLFPHFYFFDDFDISVDFNYVSGDLSSNLSMISLGYFLCEPDEIYTMTSLPLVDSDFVFQQGGAWGDNKWDASYAYVKGDTDPYAPYQVYRYVLSANTQERGRLRIVRVENVLQFFYWNYESDAWANCGEVSINPKSVHPIAVVYLGLQLPKDPVSIVYDISNFTINVGIPFWSNNEPLNLFDFAEVPVTTNLDIQYAKIIPVMDASELPYQVNIPGIEDGSEVAVRLPLVIETGKFFIPEGNVDYQLWNVIDPDGALVLEFDGKIWDRLEFDGSVVTFNEKALQVDAVNQKSNYLSPFFFLIGDFDVSVDFSYASGDIDTDTFLVGLNYFLYKKDDLKNHSTKVWYGFSRESLVDIYKYKVWANIKGKYTPDYGPFPAGDYTKGRLRIARTGKSVKHFYWGKSESETLEEQWLLYKEIIVDSDMNQPIASIFFGLWVDVFNPQIVYNFDNFTVLSGMMLGMPQIEVNPEVLEQFYAVFNREANMRPDNAVLDGDLQFKTIANIGWAASGFLATIGKNSGSWYYEVTFNNNSGVWCDSGLCQSVSEMDQMHDNRIFMLYDNMGVWSCGIQSYHPFTAMTFGIAAKLSTKEVWVRDRDGWISGGNPETGILPTCILTCWDGVTPLFPNATGHYDPCNIIVNFGQNPFTYKVPLTFNWGWDISLMSGGITLPSTADIPTGTPQLIFSTMNPETVGDAPSVPFVFTMGHPWWLTKISNYHWNSGNGALPGTIALKLDSGQIFGPWDVNIAQGSGGSPIFWVIDFSRYVFLPAGTYTVIDSDNATWSCNMASQSKGMGEVWGI